MQRLAIRHCLLVAAIAAISLSIAADACAQRGGGGRGGGRGPTGRTPPGANRQEEDAWAIVRIGSQVELVLDNDVDDVRKELEREYAAELRRYRTAEKEAARNREELDEAKPERKAFDVLKRSVRPKTEAEKLRKELVAKLVKAKVIGFSVVQVGDAYRVVANDRMNAFKKSIDHDHRKALTKHKQARREATRENVPFDEPAPVKPAVKVLPPSFEEEAQAQEYRKELGGEGAATGRAED